MKVSALFTDYDGTIAPDGVRRADSKVPDPLFSVLGRISREVPVAVITSKDLAFVRPRTTFAWAWATVLGLELTAKDGPGRQAKVVGDLGAAVARARGLLPPGVFVEEKRGSDGTLLGVSLDWTGLTDVPASELREAEKGFVKEGFQVSRQRDASYMDVYAAPADKGSAFRALVKMLQVRGPVLYLGDSEPDNDAFDESDIALCVQHGQSSGGLRCDFAVGYGGLGDVLEGLLSNGFEFVPGSVPHQRRSGAA